MPVIAPRRLGESLWRFWPDARRRLPQSVRTPVRFLYEAVRDLMRLPGALMSNRLVASAAPMDLGSPGIRLRPETRISLDNCGEDRPYLKTFEFPGPHIGAFHAALDRAPTGRMGIPFCIDLGIDGYLARAEAMKLYELAFFAPGDVLELGTYRGLSTSIIARALHDRGSQTLHTCDLSLHSSRSARRTLRWLPGFERVKFSVGDATELLDQFLAAGRKFGLIFVDHWHGYEATYSAAIRAGRLLSPGGFVMFHDYNDPSARLPDHPDKVWQAVTDAIGNDPKFRFCCVVASSGVFQRQ